MGAAVLAVALALAAGHVTAVWPSYHPLSFYDDAHYVLLARNLTDGKGLVDTSRAGNPPDTTYPPGYPLLLAPLTIAFGSELAPLRVLSLVCFLGVVALTAVWLRDRAELRPVVAGTTLVVLALNPMGATYGSMIMTEVPFLLALVGAFVAAQRWEREERTATPWGAATVVALTAAIYIKSAGLLFLPGFALYFLLRHRWARALACLAAPVVLYSPVIVRNAVLGAPLEGEAYGSQISVLRGQPDILLREAWRAIQEYAGSAFGNAIIDTRPFEAAGPVVGFILDALRIAVLPLAVFGALLAGRRRLDATLVAVPVYLVGTLAYHYTNERRLILVLPFIIYWTVCGLAGLARLAARLTAKLFAARAGFSSRGLEPSLSGLLVAAILVAPVAPQFTRDYRFFTGDTGMNPLATPSLAILRAAGRPDVAVAARPVYAVHLVTGHKGVQQFLCLAPDRLWRRFGALGAGFATFGDYRRPPGTINDPCQVRTMNGEPERYVALYRDPAEPSVTYQLVGPGSRFPDLVDALAGRRLSFGLGRVERRVEHPLVPGDRGSEYVTVDPEHGRATVGARFPPAFVVQVSIGACGNAREPPKKIDVALHTASGWHSVWHVEGRNVGPVGGSSPSDDALPFVLVKVAPTRTDGVRVAFTGPGPYEVHDLHVLVQERP